MPSTRHEREPEIDSTTEDASVQEATTVVVRTDDDPLFEAGSIVLRPFQSFTAAVRRRREMPDSSDVDTPPSRSRTFDRRTPIAIGLVAVAIGAVGGVLLTGPVALDSKMVPIGVLRIVWALATLWLARRMIPTDPSDDGRLLGAVALTFLPFAVSFSPVAGTFLTLLWALLVTIVLRVRFSSPWKRILLFVASAIGASMALTLLRWMVFNWLWLFVATRGIAG